MARAFGQLQTACVNALENLATRVSTRGRATKVWYRWGPYLSDEDIRESGIYGTSAAIRMLSVAAHAPAGIVAKGQAWLAAAYTDKPENQALVFKRQAWLAGLHPASMRPLDATVAALPGGNQRPPRDPRWLLGLRQPNHAWPEAKGANGTTSPLATGLVLATLTYWPSAWTGDSFADDLEALNETLRDRRRQHERGQGGISTELLMVELAFGLLAAQRFRLRAPQTSRPRIDAVIATLGDRLGELVKKHGLDPQGRAIYLYASDDSSHRYVIFPTAPIVALALVEADRLSSNYFAITKLANRLLDGIEQDGEVLGPQTGRPSMVDNAWVADFLFALSQVKLKTLSRPARVWDWVRHRIMNPLRSKPAKWVAITLNVAGNAAALGLSIANSAGWAVACYVGATIAILVTHGPRAED